MAVFFCSATDNTYVILGEDGYGSSWIDQAQWAGINIPLTSETGIVNVNGYSYWMGSFSSIGWTEGGYYDVGYGEEDEDEYYYTYFEACRCSLTQAVSSSQSCPANYSLNSSGLCQQQQTFNGALALSCAAGYTLNGSQCARTTSNNIVYVHSDWLGSPVAETNTSGNLVGSFMHYQAFGETIEAPKDEVGYTGHKFDTDLGLSYMQARYYDPVIGRFYSNDPVDVLGHLAGTQGVQGFNRYAYAINNPYKYTDPDGRVVVHVGGTGGGNAGASAAAATGVWVSLTLKGGIEWGTYQSGEFGSSTGVPSTGGGVEIGLMSGNWETAMSGAYVTAGAEGGPATVEGVQTIPVNGGDTSTGVQVTIEGQSPTVNVHQHNGFGKAQKLGDISPQDVIDTINSANAAIENGMSKVGEVLESQRPGI